MRSADVIYGVSNIFVLIFGFLRVFYFEKGTDFYFSNSFFHLKLGIFIIIGLLSIYPSMRINKWKKVIRKGDTPEIGYRKFKRIRFFLRMEGIAIIILILFASFMTKGWECKMNTN